MFSLSEPALLEIGVSKIGDRLYLVDCLQSLHEEVTSWKTGQGNTRAGIDPTRMLGGVSSGPASRAAAHGPGPAKCRLLTTRDLEQAAAGRRRRRLA